MILAFDTETTGLPVTQPDGRILEPHITQLSAILYNVTEQRVVYYFNSYIQLPPGVDIHPMAQKVSGITPQICKERGRPITQVLKAFYSLYSLCDTLVAHNYDFDSARIRCEIQRICLHTFPLPKYRHMFQMDSTLQKICTMKSQQNGMGGRWPKLIDLYRRVFGYSIDVAKLHHSFVDAALCLRVFLKIKYHVTISDLEFESWVNLFAAPSSSSSETRNNPWRRCRIQKSL